MNKRTRDSIILLAIGFALNVALATAKLIVGLKTNSISVMLDSTNGFLDTLTAAVALFAFIVGAKPATPKFPYGRGRSEYVAAFMASLATALTGAVFLFNSISRAFLTEPLYYAASSFIALIASVPVKIVMSVAYFAHDKRIKSKPFRALGIDSALDSCITLAAAAAFALSARVEFAIDAFFGIGISLAALGVSAHMIRDSFGALIGRNGSEEEREAIIALCEDAKSVRFVDSIRLHDYGHASARGVVRITFGSGVASDEKKRVLAELGVALREKVGGEIEFEETPPERVRSEDSPDRTHEASNSRSNLGSAEESADRTPEFPNLRAYLDPATPCDGSAEESLDRSEAESPPERGARIESEARGAEPERFAT